ncbi:zinc finger BED domain-containing protein 6-like [Dermacentor silvarum]|uniref:zinc finger BED domain-containing protein 6-like n=1 Tax=Dermacentor silvarum TaxID=543639 RepID=UPI002100968E|nr:zinc finger BED domain-containing protein 6-like [Dermacentor silvarum]
MQGSPEDPDKYDNNPIATHLRRHPDLHKDYQEKRNACERPSKLKGASKMTKMIARFVARGMHPYNIAEEPDFLDMMKFAMPDYALPSRTTFSRAIIPDLYASSTEKVKKKLGDIFASGVESLSITTDGWTSWANDSYVCVTCHVIDSDFVQHVHALACTEMTDSHTAANLELFIAGVIEEWELPAHDTVPIFVVTDNGRNFTSAVARSSWNGVQCFGHTLQLCVSDAKRELSGFLQLCAKARAIVARYKRSAKERGRLKEIQRNMQLDPLKVIHDVPT